MTEEANGRVKLLLPITNPNHNPSPNPIRSPNPNLSPNPNHSQNPNPNPQTFAMVGICDGGPFR